MLRASPVALWAATPLLRCDLSALRGRIIQERRRQAEQLALDLRRQELHHGAATGAVQNPSSPSDAYSLPSAFATEAALSAKYAAEEAVPHRVELAALAEKKQQHVERAREASEQRRDRKVLWEQWQAGQREKGAARRMLLAGRKAEGAKRQHCERLSKRLLPVSVVQPQRSEAERRILGGR